MSDDSPRNHESDPEEYEILKKKRKKIQHFVSSEIIRPLWRGFVFGMAGILGVFTLSQIREFNRDQLIIYAILQTVNCLPIA